MAVSLGNLDGLQILWIKNPSHKCVTQGSHTDVQTLKFVTLYKSKSEISYVTKALKINTFMPLMVKLRFTNVLCCDCICIYALDYTKWKVKCMEWIFFQSIGSYTYKIRLQIQSLKMIYQYNFYNHRFLIFKVAKVMFAIASVTTMILFPFFSNICIYWI